MVGWLKDLTLVKRRTMPACFGGWSLDALDVQIFTFMILSLLAVWGSTRLRPGRLATGWRARPGQQERWRCLNANGHDPVSVPAELGRARSHRR